MGVRYKISSGITQWDLEQKIDALLKNPTWKCQLIGGLSVSFADSGSVKQYFQAVLMEKPDLGKEVGG